MKSWIDIYDPSSNFWDVNPQYKTMSPFKELYKKDRKRTKLDSSKDMWFITGILDPKSRYSSIEEDPDVDFGQFKVISRDLADGDEKWLYDNYERLKEYIDAYAGFRTPAQLALLSWERKLKQRNEIIDNTDYEVGITDSNGKYVGSNVKMLDDMLVAMPKLWDQYFVIAEKVKAEGSEKGTVKGDSEASASDLGKI